MALTDQEMADAIGAELADATRLRATAEAVVAKYAAGAPEAIRDEAAIRVAGYILDAPPSPSGDGHAAILRNSGAAGLLAPWRARRAGAIRDAS